MNKASRIAAAINSQANPFQLRACLFHCTPISERNRRTHWDPACFYKGSPKKFNQYRRRLMKKSLLRNVNEFAEHMFQKWESDRDECDEPQGRKHSWFRPNFRDGGYRRGRSRNRGPQSFRSRFEFCEDDDDVDAKFETIFRSVFGGNESSHWSFTMDDEPRFRRSSTHSSYYRTFSGWKYQFDEEYEEYTSSSQYERPLVNESRSDRLALGLSPSGPLSIEDVKNAYRSCALKWHPDRHQGSSKAIAEEKFKACSAAYQSLSDKMALN
ncbi:hypothetical protein C2S52_018847 [Perilla frutescens var. hirtella]|nr:hypothetical protein C2S52_018847 [Perilla frutescens var. hirtella]